MAIEKVKEFFRKFAMEHRVLEFPTSSATVELAAAVLGCESARIAKTLSFSAGDKTILIVTAGDSKVDNQKFKSYFGFKAKMLKNDEVEKAVGHAVGGVCPFAVNEGVSIYLDVSLKRFSSVFPACGSGSSAIELTTEELEKYAKPISWIDVCKLSEKSENNMTPKNNAF